LVYSIVEHVVDKVTLLETKDLEMHIEQVKSALLILNDISDHLKLDLTLEKNLVSCVFETNFIKLLKTNSAFRLHDIFKDYIVYLYIPFEKSIFLNTHSVFQALLKFLKKHPEKWSELPRLLLDPQVKEYEYYMDLKFNYYSSLCASFIKTHEDQNKSTESLMFETPQKEISVNRLSEQCGYRVIYRDSPDQFEMFLFDFNVFLSLNLLFTSIRLISVFVDLQSKEVSLSLNYFGTSLFEFIKETKRKDLRIETTQILFILKLIAEAVIDLLSHKIHIEFLHPYNIYLMDNQICIIPKSYFGQCLECEEEEEGLDVEVFRCFDGKDGLEKGLSYSLGVIFLYFKDQNLTVSGFLGQRERILKNCDFGTRDFVEGLIGDKKRYDLRQVLDLL